MIRRLFLAILLIMSLVLRTTALEAAPAFKARPVTEAQVMKMLYTFNAPVTEIRDFGEIASSIAIASTQDPLFPEIEEGSEMTAAMLVALAWHESRFRRSAVGDQGRSLGLYQIQPTTHRIDSKVLMLPRTASFVAIGLLKKSIRWCFLHHKPWRHMMAWYAASSDEGAQHPVIIQQSVKRMETAASIFLHAFGKPQGEPQVERLLTARVP